MKVLWGVALVCAAVSFGWLAASAPVAALAVIGAVAWGLWVYTAKRRRALAVAGTGTVFVACLFPLFSLGDYGGLKWGVLAAVAALLLGAALLRPKSVRSAVRRVRMWLVYLLALVAVTVLGGGGEPDLMWPVLLVGAGVALCFAGMSPDEMAWSGRAMLAMGAAQSLYAVGEVAGQLPQLWPDGVARPSQIFDGLARAQGTFAHPLPLALFLLVCLALAPRLVRSGVPRLALVMLLGVGVLMTGSRSAAVVGAVVVAMSLARRPATRVASGAAVLGLSLLALGQSGAAESDVVQQFGASASLSHRQGALDAVPGLLAGQDPLAVAFGNGAFSEGGLFDAGLLQSGAFHAVDNQVVTTLVELGLLGVALLAAVAWKAAGRWATPWGMALCAVLAFFFSFDVLLWPSGAAVFAMCFGAAVSTGPQQATRRASPRAPRGAVRSRPGAGQFQRWPEPAPRLPH